MELTIEQIEFLNRVVVGFGDDGWRNGRRLFRSSWKLNNYGRVDTHKSVDMSNMKLTEIPVKFGRVEGYFNCSDNQLTTLKNCPTYVGSDFVCNDNDLTSLKTPYLKFGYSFSKFYFNGNPRLNDYFKSIKRKDFKYWGRIEWVYVLKEYPFLINIGKRYLNERNLKYLLERYPHLKLYLE